MKILALVFVCLALAVPSRSEDKAKPQPVNYENLINAISMVETGSKDNALGKRGERSRYQFTYDTWKTYTDAPFAESAKFTTAHRVALAHVEFLEFAIKDMTDDPNLRAYLIACAWNGGQNAVLRGEITAPTIEYADAVVSLYLIMQKEVVHSKKTL